MSATNLNIHTTADVELTSFGACPGKNNSGNTACALGFKGILCATCSIGYSFNGRTYISCESNNKGAAGVGMKIGIALGVISILIVIAIVFWRW